jgi:hypothetical protein
MIRVDISRKDNLGAVLRRLVENGAPDQPAEIWIECRHCLSAASLHRAACLTVVEDPSPRFAPYTPHPKAKIGPRVAALLTADRERRQRMREAPKTASAVPGGG